jgi:hypothetical protein
MPSLLHLAIWGLKEAKNGTAWKKTLENYQPLTLPTARC